MVRVPAQWGAVEREPRGYNWSGYKQLFEVIKQTGLKAQVRVSVDLKVRLQVDL